MIVKLCHCNTFARFYILLKFQTKNIYENIGEKLYGQQANNSTFCQILQFPPQTSSLYLQELKGFDYIGKKVNGQ